MGRWGNSYQDGVCKILNGGKCRVKGANFTKLKIACYKCEQDGDIAVDTTKNARQKLHEADNSVRCEWALVNQVRRTKTRSTLLNKTLEIMHEHQFAANGVPINALADSRPG